MIKLKQNLFTFFSIFTKKAWIFEPKMSNFQILIEWPEMIVSGCYITQNDRNKQPVPEINVRGRYCMQNISNLSKKKLGGTKMSIIFFVIFGFVPYVGQLKVVSLSKLSHQICTGKFFLLSVSALSYLKNLSESD